MTKIWSKNWEDDFLYAVYDLDVSAITFNVAEFLVDAEYEANKRNKNGFVVVFVPPSNDQHLVWDEYDSLIDATNRQWRLQNIVIPLTYLSKKCKGTYILPQRSDANTFIRGREVYPDLYDSFNLRSLDTIKFFKKFDRPNLFEGLSAPKQGLRYIQTWLSENSVKDPVVTITIRDMEFDKPRNSNIEAWSQFATYLLSVGYYPVVIPDTGTAFREDGRFDGISVFKECAWNICLRMSLYESAFLNFFVSNGCSALTAYSPKHNYIIMNFYPEESMVTTEEARQKTGMDIGDNYKFATPGQWLIYKPDTFENIVYEFERFVREQKP